MNRATYLEQMDDYLAGRLGDSARQAFEAALAADPDLKAELSAQQGVREWVIDRGLLDLKARMAELEKDIRKEPAKPQNPARPRKGTLGWFGMAGATLILGLGMWLLNMERKTPAPSTTTTQIKPRTSLAPTLPSEEKQTLPAPAKPQAEDLSPASGTVAQAAPVVNGAQARMEAPVHTPGAYQASTPSSSTPAAPASVATQAMPTPPVASAEPVKPAHEPAAQEKKEHAGSHKATATHPSAQPVEPEAQPEKKAAPAKPLNFRLAPSRGETWKPELSFTGTALLVIRDKGGREILRHTLGEGDFWEWNGRDQNGGDLPMGLLLWELNQNGQNLYRGTITIVR